MMSSLPATDHTAMPARSAPSAYSTTLGSGDGGSRCRRRIAGEKSSASAPSICAAERIPTCVRSRQLHQSILQFGLAMQGLRLLAELAGTHRTLRCVDRDARQCTVHPVLV